MKYVIIAKRSHPEQNKKIGIKQQLQKYFELDEKFQEISKYFITFTQLPKVGINPSSTFNTPIGVCTYPVKEVVASTGDYNVPFTGINQAKYIQVIERVSNNTLSDITYNKSDYNKDLNKLKKWFNNQKQNKKIIQNRIKFFILSHPNIKEKFINTDIDTTNFNFPDKINFSTAEIISNESASILADSNKRKIHEIDYIWTLTDTIASFFYIKTNVIWNKLLQYLGYDLVSDSGLGFIHPNEKCQTIFLNPKSYKQVDMIKL